MKIESGKVLRAFNWLCVIVVFGILAARTWHHHQTRWFELPVKAELNDFGVNVANSTQICQDPNHHYWRDFVYPPPAVLLFNAFGKHIYPAGFLVWLGLLGASLAGSFLLAQRVTSTGSAAQAILLPPSGLILALGFAATEYYCLWDLHVVNTNSIYLFLVLAALWCWVNNRPASAGFLLGASVAVKIYSVFFLPFLLLRRRWRMAAVGCLSLAFFFIGLPAVFFGVQGGLQITVNWLRTVASAGNPDYMLNYSGYKISFAWVAMLLLDPRASAGHLNVLEWNPKAVLWLIRICYAIWLVLVLAYFVKAKPLPVQTRNGRLALALDSSVLLMFPLPLSPFLQPPHPVVLLLPAIALLRYALEWPVSLPRRIGSILAVGSGVFIELAHYPWRGIGAMLNIASLFVGAWLVRRALNAECRMQSAE